MANFWYIDGDNGADTAATAGKYTAKQTVPDARRTLPADADVTAGDTLYIKNNVRGIQPVYTKPLSLLRWPGAATSVIRGDTLATGTWTVDSGAYYLVIAAPTYGITGVVIDWDTSLTAAEGFHYGHLNAAASKAACQATDNSWYYESGTTRLYIRIGANLAPSGFSTIGYCDVLGRALVKFNGAVGTVTISGVDFYLRPQGVGEPADSGNHPYLLYITGTSTAVVRRNSRDIDGGLHLDDINDVDFATGVTMEDIHADGCMVGTNLVFGSTTALNYIQNVRVTGGTDKIRGLLGRDQLELSGTGGSTGTYTHPGGGGEVRDILIRNRRFVGYSAYTRGIPFGYDESSVVTAGNKWDSTTDPFRVEDCDLVGNLDVTAYRSMAMKRCRFTNIPGADGNFSDTRGITLTGAAAGYHRLLLECCVVIFDFTKALTTTASHGVAVINAGVTGFEIVLNNCLIINLSAQVPDAPSFTWRPLITPGYNTASILARRCIFAHKTAATMHALSNWDDGNTTWDVQDCLYYNIDASRFAENASYNAQSEWFASIDTGGPGATRQVLATSPIRDWSTGAWDQAHPAFRLKAVNTEHEPTTGIDGRPYIGKYGPFQSRGDSSKLNRARGTRLRRV